MFGPRTFPPKAKIERRFADSEPANRVSPNMNTRHAPVNIVLLGQGQGHRSAPPAGGPADRVAPNRRTASQPKREVVPAGITLVSLFFVYDVSRSHACVLRDA
jgi:hypothetical protein